MKYKCCILATVWVSRHGSPLILGASVFSHTHKVDVQHLAINWESQNLANSITFVLVYPRHLRPCLPLLLLLPRATIVTRFSNKFCAHVLPWTFLPQVQQPGHNTN